MTKPSKKERINIDTSNDPTAIVERVKKLREMQQTEKVKEEIKRLTDEYKKRFLNFLRK